MLVFEEKPGSSREYYIGEEEQDESDAMRSDLEFPTEGRRNEIPYRDEVIAHLRLMEAFYKLREEIEDQDGIFGIYDWMKFPNPKADLYGRTPSPQTLVKEVRWGLYVQRAAARYEEWWKHVLIKLIDDDDQRRLQVYDVEEGSDYFENWSKKTDYNVKLSEDMLPPLDVLMVWHAHMLNPRAYTEDCIRQGVGFMWHDGMPWDLINQALGSNAEYYPSPGAVKFFEVNVGRQWENRHDDMYRRIQCVKCDCVIKVPWISIVSGDGESEVEIDEVGYGYENMRIRCGGCGVLYTHEVLRVLKFQEDLEDFFMNGNALPACVLRDGLDWKVSKPSWNRSGIYKVIGSQKLREEINNFVRTEEEVTIKRVRAIVDKYARARLTQSREVVLLVKVLNRYWNNLSLFSVELTGAVVRQSVFIQEIINYGWYNRCKDIDQMIERYQNFVGLFDVKNYKLVPTIDVDLIWHTHQLKPQLYYQYSIRQTGYFIEHRDKVEETALSELFLHTCKLYNAEYGGNFPLCACWYCSIVASGESKIDPFYHISAHNSIIGDDMTLKKKQAYAHKLKRSAHSKALRPAHISEYPYVSTTLSREYWGSFI